MDPTLAAMGEESFVALTTFRRNGEPVATPVWVARAGEALVVTTVDGSGKVERIRRNPDVTLQPCGRRGAVPDGAPTAHARAEVVSDPARNAPAIAALRSAYGVQFRVLLWLEQRMARGRRERVILWLTEHPDHHV